MVEQIANSNAVARSEYDAVKVLPKEPKGLASGTPAFEHDIKALIINGDTVDIRVDKEGRINLNDIRQASPLANTRKKEISQWLGAAKTKKLINSLQSATQICVTVKTTGGINGGSTYVHPDIALAYAAAVDNDFYVNVAKTFGNVVRGDIDAAIEEASRAVLHKESKENDEGRDLSL